MFYSKVGNKRNTIHSYDKDLKDIREAVNFNILSVLIVIHVLHIRAAVFRKHIAIWKSEMNTDLKACANTSFNAMHFNNTCHFLKISAV